MAKNIKIAVRYQSRGGNTKAVAEAIGNAVGAKAEPIDVPLNKPADILFVGGGVYGWDIDKSLKNYLENIDSNTVKSVAVFSTAGGMNGAGKIIALLKSKGINVYDDTLPVKFGVRNHSLLGGKGNITLSDKQKHSIDEFVKKILK